MLEKRVARTRHEHAVSRIAQQLEQPAVRLARARRQDDGVGIDLGAAPETIGGDRLACGSDAQRVRLVREGARVRQRGEQRARIREAGGCRVGIGQVDERHAPNAHGVDRAAERVGFLVWRQSMREHAVTWGQRWSGACPRSPS